MSTQRKKQRMHMCVKGMCALAGRLAWESGVLVRVESSHEERQKPRLEKPKRDFSIRQMLSFITHTHVVIHH